jgi:hypothetical protein
VTGTISAPTYSGVTVNGVVAIVDAGGNFYANGVQPEAGKITAVVTTVDEVQGATVLTLTGGSPATQGASQVLADRVEDVASIQSRFTAFNSGGIRRVDVDFGAGSIAYSTTSDPAFVPGRSDWKITLSYSGVGVYRPIVYVTEMNGNTTQHSFALSVVDPTALNQVLQDLWVRMTAKVKMGDIPGAVKVFVQGQRQSFQSVLQDLQPDPVTAVGQLGTLSPRSATADDAEYRLVRQSGGTTRAFPVFFIRDRDGVWRISDM